MAKKASIKKTPVNRRPEKGTVHHAGLVLPDLKLNRSQINRLKNRFKDELITTLGGQDALTRREVSLCEVTVVEKQIVAAPGAGRP
jgi:hypothetical protein